MKKLAARRGAFSAQEPDLGPLGLLFAADRNRNYARDNAAHDKPSSDNFF
jgi:hypothetical protein